MHIVSKTNNAVLVAIAAFTFIACVYLSAIASETIAITSLVISVLANSFGFRFYSADPYNNPKDFGRIANLVSYSYMGADKRVKILITVIKISTACLIGASLALAYFRALKP